MQTDEADAIPTAAIVSPSQNPYYVVSSETASTAMLL
jgi:hypothetical protein